MSKTQKTAKALALLFTLATTYISCMDHGHDIYIRTTRDAVEMAIKARDWAELNNIIAHIPEDQKATILCKHTGTQSPPLWYCIMRNYEQAAAILMNAIAPADRVDCLNSEDCSQFSLLVEAIRQKYSGMVRLLLASVPADQRASCVNKESTCRTTPLYMLDRWLALCMPVSPTYFEYLEIAKMLIGLGGDLEQPTTRTVAFLINRRKQAREQARALTRSQAFTMMQTQQGRLGADSPAALLSQDILRDLVMPLAREANQSDAINRVDQTMLENLRDSSCIIC